LGDWRLQVAKTLNEKISQFLQVTLDICAYAGKGEVLTVGSWGMCWG
jgi:hypothetical protein